MRILRGGGGGGVGGFSRTHFDSKLHFHGKFWINILNIGHFSLYVSSTSPFHYLQMRVQLPGGCQTVNPDQTPRSAVSTLFTQACLSEYEE